jgi:predicted Zn-dependent protease with MMP-like domain
MHRRRFERLVERAIARLPSEYRDRLDGVAFVVKRRPTVRDLYAGRVPRGHTLFGLYQGVPLTLQGSQEPLLPAKITIYQQPIEQACRDEDTIEEQVLKTIWHEVAHHFGISDDRLYELGMQ